MADDQLGAVRLAGLDHGVGCGHADGHGLFADDSAGTACGRGNGGCRMQKVPSADTDDVGPGLFHHLCDCLKLLRDAVCVHVGFAGHGDRVGDGDHLDLVHEIVAFHVGVAYGSTADNCRGIAFHRGYLLGENVIAGVLWDIIKNRY